MQVDLQNGYGRPIATEDRAALYSAALLRSLGKIKGRAASGVFDLPDGGDSYSEILDFAEAIASGNADGAPADKEGLDKNANLRRIFNCVNGHSDSNETGHEPYEEIIASIKKGLEQVPDTLDGVNGLADLLEDTVGAVPASVDPSGLIDVSLYDYAKATACFATCAQDYLASLDQEKREAMLSGDGGADLFAEPMFLLLSCDISGIQSFIYSISGSGALRQLRARSLYLELLLEIIIDEMLARIGMRRPNLQYSGGGHFYLLLPNTEQCKAAVEECWEEVSAWQLDQFGIDLFLAGAWVECSAYDFMNHPKGHGYASVYSGVSRKLSYAKASRYPAGVLRKLNYGASKQIPGERECTECHRSDRDIDGDGKCPFCAALGEISRGLAKRDVFVVAPYKDAGGVNNGLTLPFGYRLLFKDPAIDDSAVRIYEKNTRGRYDGSRIRLWVADYCADMGNEGITAYEKNGIALSEGKGIERLGVMRADVDNLGTTFVSGIPAEKLSFSRSSVLSRSISYFFKVKLNEILEKKGYQAQVIYSGGDDLFIVGNWSDILYAAIDIRSGLAEYVGSNALTISAGIGMFNAKYPIARIASEVGELEDAAKLFSAEKDGIQLTKNAVALWTKENVFGWDEFVDEIVPRKDELESIFSGNEKGNTFAYKLIDLLRNFDDVSSAPRLAYLLARSFEKVPEKMKGKINELYSWALDENARRYLTAALEWYVYSIRGRS